MLSAPRLGSRLRAAAPLLPASVVAALAFWSFTGAERSGTATPATPSSAVAVAVPGGHGSTAGQIVVQGPKGHASVTLDDTGPARALAAMLPLRLTLSDPMGQAKSGQLPFTIDVTGADRVVHGSVGALYYWAPTNTVAIFYDDLGQTVPPPGLVRLGIVDSGLSTLSSAGNRFTARFDPADGTATTQERP